jgi:hypothetical protein
VIQIILLLMTRRVYRSPAYWVISCKTNGFFETHIHETRRFSASNSFGDSMNQVSSHPGCVIFGSGPLIPLISRLISLALLNLSKIVQDNKEHLISLAVGSGSYYSIALGR